MSGNSGDKKVINVQVPDSDPKATKKMFVELKKRKRWQVFGPDRGSLIPRKRKP
jgi:hypothetical protein